jgi:hypothetical protein
MQIIGGGSVARIGDRSCVRPNSRCLAVLGYIAWDRDRTNYRRRYTRALSNPDCHWNGPGSTGLRRVLPLNSPIPAGRMRAYARGPAVVPNAAAHWMGSLPNVSASAVGDRIARAEPQLLRCQLLAGPLIADIRLY